MPDYNFVCDKCNKKFSKSISYIEYGKREIHCPVCMSVKITRHIGRVRIARSESRRIQEMNDLADPENLDVMQDNPRELGKTMRRMSEEVGEEIGPEFNEVVKRLESGQSTDEIERALPDFESSASE